MATAVVLVCCSFLRGGGYFQAVVKKGHTVAQQAEWVQQGTKL